MSYILDALRRAEADRERERGQVPGLHTQALSGSDAASAAGPRRWLPWAGGGLMLLAGIGAGSWWASGQQEAASPVALPVSQPAPAPAPTEAATAPPALQPAAQPAASVPMPEPAASASPYLPPVPPPGAVPAPAPVAAAKPAPVPAAPPASVEAPILRLAELPESTRRELPKLTISGSVYSDDPASRFVMVNGEVVREGAKLGADLVLEQIRPRELVLRFKGQRFRQPV
jgi:general secretion pathway protein B